MIQPPKWPFKVLRWFCKSWYVETIEGDLLEIFDREVARDARHAKGRLCWSVMRFIRFRYIKNLEDFFPSLSFGMLKNYIKVFLRTSLKNRTQSLLNVLGLSIGIAACLLMIMHVTGQLRYDRHVADVDRVFYVTNGNQGRFTPALLVKYMVEEYPEVEAGTRVNGLFPFTVDMGGKYIRLEGGLTADSTFFDVFSMKFIHGTPQEALNDPDELVLTKSTAEKLFPTSNPVGERLMIGGTNYTVTAVVADPPKSSSIPFQFILTMPRHFMYTTGYWTGYNFFSYLKLKPGANAEVLQSKFPDFVKRHMAAEILAGNKQYQTFEEYLADGNDRSFSLIPMKDIHLHYGRLSLGVAGDYDSLVIFSAVAAFILLIACFNYINMSTARASLRTKEIGVRKVMGSIRQTIARQFWIEALLTTTLAVVIGIGLACFILPYFNRVSQGSYTPGDLLNLEIFGYLLVIVALAGSLAGSYPALYMASFDVVSSLKGERRIGDSGKVRATLLVIQFAVSLVLMIATYIVYLQLDLMSHRKLGLDADQVYNLLDTREIAGRYDAFKAELMNDAAITEVGIASSYPSQPLANWTYRTVEENPRLFDPRNIFVTSEVKDVWGLQLKEGRFFDSNLATDSMNVVINETFADLLGWKDPVGHQLSRGNGEDFRIIGIVQNFEMGSAKAGEHPLLFRHVLPSRFKEGEGYFTIKLSGDVSGALHHIDAAWDDFSNGYPTEGIFMDDSFQHLYEGERRFGLMFTGFAMVAIFIACIGLFSLASFIMERKRKEIALRKVMGAQAGQIFQMIAFSLGRLVLIGAAVAIPVAYWLGHSWLANYKDRIIIGPWLFLFPLLLLIVVGFLTIFYETVQTAMANPVSTLKDE